MYGLHALEKEPLLEVKMQTPQNTGHVGYRGLFKIIECSYAIFGPITVAQRKNNTASSLESTLGDFISLISLELFRVFKRKVSAVSSAIITAILNENLGCLAIWTH